MFIIYMLGVLSATSLVLSSSFPEFSDNLVYDITWNEPLSKQDEEKNTREKIVIVTSDNEKYQCLIPLIIDESDSKYDIEHGPGPEVLLAEVLFGTPPKCSIRLEPYWSYEICHGQHVIQYHEEKDSDGNVKRDEYILGKLTKEEATEILAGPKNLDNESPNAENKKAPTKVIDGKETPYFSIEMSNGTPCDLNGQPRSSKIVYVCHSGANNEVISVKEVTTCEYEVIVLTPMLCGNPAYIIKTEPVNDIRCHAMDGSRTLPLGAIHQDGNTYTITTSPVRNKIPEPPIDETINRNFLGGTYCLIGGSGWWNYEFCNGKHIQQFHEEISKPKTKITLGVWDKGEHLKMVKSQEIKPKGKKHVIHWYSNGDICDLTGEPRTAMVILTCKKGKGQQLSIYMTEPSACKYQIGVESPILCPLVEKADENGLFEL